MFEKVEKLQLVVMAIILAFGIYFSTKCAVNTTSKDGISVTGSAYEIVKSDSAKLDLEILVQAKTKAQAYTILKKQLPIVKQYLNDNGLQNYDVKTYNGYYTYKYNPTIGNYTNEVDSYKLTQQIEINSNEVDKIKELSLDIQELLDRGIDINVTQISYYYSKLSDLKVALLKKATEDAKMRASGMLNATHNKVGKIQSVRMGVFQITSTDSNEVSDIGINDTSTIDKKVTAVANVVFKIK